MKFALEQRFRSSVRLRTTPSCYVEGRGLTLASVPLRTYTYAPLLFTCTVYKCSFLSVFVLGVHVGAGMNARGRTSSPQPASPCSVLLVTCLDQWCKVKCTKPRLLNQEQPHFTSHYYSKLCASALSWIHGVSVSFPENSSGLDLLALRYPDTVERLWSCLFLGHN